MTALAPAPRTKTSRRSPLRLFEALATPHGVDRYLELVHPMLTVRDLRAVVTDVRRSTADSVTLTLRPTRQWRGFRAGQFVQLTVEIDGVLRTRCYSPCCSQYRTDGQFEITIKAHEQGLVSQWLHANARRGLVLGLAQADGAFTLPERRPERIVLVSGGSGITPVLSMLRSLCDEGFPGEVAFLHYARTLEDVALRTEVEALAAQHGNVHVRFVSTSTEGHFDAAQLEAVAPWHADAEVYVCGPSGLMDDVRALCGDRVRAEEFQPTPLVATNCDATGTVSFARAGAETSNSGATLLEQAEAAGLNPAYGCRMGICFSCTQIKTSGCTRNIRTGETDSDPDTEIQLCINVPVGDVALDI
jgi:stearoyl-CoA 9-desaturase NADPH oxidoreductase